MWRKITCNNLSSEIPRRKIGSSPAGRAAGKRRDSFGTMSRAVQAWLSSHRTSQTAAVLISVCLAWCTILLGASHHGVTPCIGSTGVAPKNVPWWKRRHLRPCSEDPFSDSKTPPPHFLEGISRRKAQENWDATRRWRRENDMGTILQRPPKRLELIRKVIPSSFYQHDLEHHLVVIEKWGEVDAHEIKRHGLTHDDLVYAYMYELEWLYSVAIPDPKDKITLIMDVGGVTFSQFTAWETMHLVRDRINIGCQHYPNRAAHLLVVNAPSFFSGVYRLAEHLLSDQTKRKIKVLSEDDLEDGAITKIIHPKQLLPEYGGKSKVEFGNSSVDQKLMKYIQKARRKGH